MIAYHDTKAVGNEGCKKEIDGEGKTLSIKVRKEHSGHPTQAGNQKELRVFLVGLVKGHPLGCIWSVARNVVLLRFGQLGNFHGFNGACLYVRWRRVIFTGMSYLS